VVQILFYVKKGILNSVPFIQCVRKVAVHLYKLLELMYTSVSYRPESIPSASNTDPVPRISQQVYELHCDEVQVFLRIFQPIAPVLIGVFIAFSKDVLN
jgi:hypothetical protein